MPPSLPPDRSSSGGFSLARSRSFVRSFPSRLRSRHAFPRLSSRGWFVQRVANYNELGAQMSHELMNEVSGQGNSEWVKKVWYRCHTLAAVDRSS